MRTKSLAQIESSIEAIEQRMELRRMRMRADVAALSHIARQRLKPVPFFVAAVFAIGGFALARARSDGSRAAQSKATLAGAGAKAGFLATLVAATRIAIRLANNPWVREQWNLYWQRRARHVP